MVEKYDTVEAISKLAEPDPEFIAYLAENPLKLPPMDDITIVRNMRAKMELTIGSRYQSSTRVVAMRDDHSGEVRVFTPINPPPTGSPLIILVHAGGFSIGTNYQMAPFAHAFASLYGATVVNVTHRPAPENKFPTAPNDVWDTVKYVAENSASFGADPVAGFIIGGISSGANLAAVTVQRAVTDSLSPAPSGMWLSIPLLLDPAIVPLQYTDLYISREQAGEAPLVDTKNLSRIMKDSKPDVHSPQFSPFNAPEPHKGMPRTYVQVNGLDPMRDDGLVYERALRDAGVETKLDVYPGVPHWHFGFFPMLQSSRKAKMDAIAAIGWLLGKETAKEGILNAMDPPLEK